MSSVVAISATVEFIGSSVRVLLEFHDGPSDEAVVAPAEGAVVHEYHVFVLRLIRVALHGQGGALRAAVGDVEVHVVVGSLLEELHGFVHLRLRVVGHAAGRIEPPVCECPLQVEAAIMEGRIVPCQGEVYEDVVGLGVVVLRLVVADEVASVLVHVITVVAPAFVGEQHGMVIRVEEAHMVHSLCGIMHVGQFEAAVFVACVEDEAAVMHVLQLPRLLVGGRDAGHHVVPPLVLEHLHFHFRCRVADVVIVVVDAEAHLLVGAVGVDVGVAAHGGGDAHLLLHYGEAGVQYMLAAVVVIVNAHDVVA